jgi:hypothetical protein
MKTTTLAALALVALALSMSPDSMAGPGGKPSASASAAARVEIPPWPDPTKHVAFDAEPFAEDKSKAPSQDEWKGAAEVRLSHVAPLAASCRAYRVREWIKIHCERKTAALRLIAGSTEGVAMFTANGIGDRNTSSTFFETMGRFGQLIFPVRRGDRRLFEWVDFDFGEWEGWGVDSSFVVEEAWPEGAKGPEIALRAR